jgi:hypothetical protein
MKSQQLQLHILYMHLKHLKVLFLLIVLSLFNFNSSAQQLAFPTASGAGAYATGGRGYTVFKVTNLNNAGPGSLRQAVYDADANGGGNVVFTVSGAINLTSNLGFVGIQNVSIWGQTAPEGGISVANKLSGFYAGNSQTEPSSNIIIRFMRFRVDSSPLINSQYNGLETDVFVMEYANNYIIDHCSFSFGTDEAINHGNGENVTWQHNLIAENSKAMIMGQVAQQQGNFSFNNNLFTRTSHRFVNVESGGRVDLINNYIYDWYSSSAAPRGAFQLNHINNYFGPNGADNNIDLDWRGFNYVQEQWTPSIHASGNIYENVFEDPNADNIGNTNTNNDGFWRIRTTFGNDGVIMPQSWRVAAPYALLGEPFTIRTAAEIKAQLPDNVGAHKRLDENGFVLPGLDILDNMYITSVKNEIHTNWQLRDSYFGDLVGNSEHYDAYFSTVGIVINTHPAGYDTDNDGMPDVWEINMFDDLTRDGTGDENGNGYSDLEEYLHGVDGTAGIVADAGNDISICEGASTILTATGGVTYLWNTGATTASIDVSPNTTTTYTVIAYNSAGTSEDSDDVVVTVNQIPAANAGEDLETCLGTPLTLTVTGGTGVDTTYLWSTLETTATIIVNPTSTTTYSVEVFENNCSSADDVIVTVNEVPAVDAGEDQTIFEGESATLTATGADTYLWSTLETTQSITVNPLLDTSYSVTGTTNNCENTDAVTVFLLDDSVNANAGDNTEICIGESATLTATGGTTYLWNTGETTTSIEVSPAATTLYTVTAYSISGNNTAEDSVEVTVNELPIANAGDDVAICFGNSTTLTASGGTTYLWSTGETTETITVNPIDTTIYTVEAFENNCSSVDNVEVIINALPETNAGDDVSIFDGASTTLTASNADSYVWSTGETTTSITVSPNNTTTYSVTGTNSNGCEFMNEVTVTVISDDVTANAGDDVTVCSGENTTLTASGGTTYLWNTGETTASIEVSPAATTLYTVTAYSISGNNTAEDSVEVTVNELPIANAGDDVAICFGNSTTLTASGGTTYLWSTGETTETITVNPIDTTIYTVEAFENNCSSVDDVEVIINALPETNAGNDISITEGAATILTASGADSYAWNTGETTSSITVSPNTITTYTVTGANSNGCEFIDEVIVTTILDDITANAGVDIAICNGESTTLTASGGASYLWNTGESTAAIEVSPLGTTIYTVTAYSISGNNTDEDSVEVTVNEIPAANAGDDISICFGNGTTLTASGGTTYLWSTGQTSETIAVNPNNTTIYTVEVFESNCSSVDEIQVTVNELPETNAGNNVSIFEGDFITLTASGADSYVWSTSETSASISVSPNNTTTYTVTGTNSNGCEFSDSVIVSVETEFIDANAGTNVAICNGESISLIASGGASYLWSTGQTTANIAVSPLATTIYTVTVFSSNGTQSDDDSVTVIVNEIPIANAGNNVTACFGNVTTLAASGGTTYLWSTGETTEVIMVSPNITTTYTVEVFANNCSSTDDITITVNNLPETNAGNDVTITEGDSTALTVTGAASYIWSTGETTSSISVNPMVTTTYTITGMSNGCESIDQVIVTVEPFIFIASAGSNQTICQGYETTLTASDGDSYLWSTGETAQSIMVQPTNTQIYTVTVFDGVYQDDAAVEVSVNPNPNVVIANGGDVMILEGEFITLSASGANTYAWDNGAIQPNISVSPSNTTTYEVTGFINSCEDTKAIIVNVLEIVQADAGEDVFICDQEIVVLTANGGDAYLWNTGEITQTIEVAPNEDTAYSVLVYNALDSDEDTVTVFVEECSSTVEIPIDSDAVDFMIYQDPNTNILKVKIDGLQTITATGYSIYDLTGKTLYTETFNQSEMEELSQMTRELDVSTYSRGLYVVQLIYNDTSLIKKIPIK